MQREFRSEREQPNVEEITYGKTQRSLSLPAKVDPKSASATYEDDILTVTLPKSVSARARTIPLAKPSAQQEKEKPSEGTVEKETIPVESASPA